MISAPRALHAPGAAQARTKHSPETIARSHSTVLDTLLSWQTKPRRDQWHNL